MKKSGACYLASYARDCHQPPSRVFVHLCSANSSTPGPYYNKIEITSTYTPIALLSILQQPWAAGIHGPSKLPDGYHRTYKTTALHGGFYALLILQTDVSQSCVA